MEPIVLQDDPAVDLWQLVGLTINGDAPRAGERQSLKPDSRFIGRWTRAHNT